MSTFRSLHQGMRQIGWTSKRKVLGWQQICWWLADMLMVQCPRFSRLAHFCLCLGVESSEFWSGWLQVTWTCQWAILQSERCNPDDNRQQRWPATTWQLWPKSTHQKDWLPQTANGRPSNFWLMGSSFALLGEATAAVTTTSYYWLVRQN